MKKLLIFIFMLIISLNISYWKDYEYNTEYNVWDKKFISYRGISSWYCNWWELYLEYRDEKKLIYKSEDQCILDIEEIDENNAKINICYWDWAWSWECVFIESEYNLDTWKWKLINKSWYYSWEKNYEFPVSKYSDEKQTLLDFHFDYNLYKLINNLNINYDVDINYLYEVYKDKTILISDKNKKVLTDFINTNKKLLIDNYFAITEIISKNLLIIQKDYKSKDDLKIWIYQYLLSEIYKLKFWDYKNK